ncbi:hypothetical protein CPB84DRAFT_1019806 [Gymnopilus junonius]|uniref:Uncharacterized protein n=1 Tax=Gymnopilus junonius TaxID=109634 RepID=A0A9P5NNC4_GYMJU|nr:hypothetical protein CPB84DRAFT_1019806 [Gymnopilus junonius]
MKKNRNVNKKDAFPSWNIFQIDMLPIHPPMCRTLPHRNHASPTRHNWGGTITTVNSCRHEIPFDFVLPGSSSSCSPSVDFVDLRSTFAKTVMSMTGYLVSAFYLRSVIMWFREMSMGIYLLECGVFFTHNAFLIADALLTSLSSSLLHHTFSLLFLITAQLLLTLVFICPSPTWMYGASPHTASYPSSIASNTPSVLVTRTTSGYGKELSAQIIGEDFEVSHPKA